MGLQSKYDHATELARSQPAEVKMAYLVNELGIWAKANPGALQILHSEFAGLLREMREQATTVRAALAEGAPAIELQPSAKFSNNAARLDREQQLARAIIRADHAAQITWITEHGHRVAAIVPAPMVSGEDA